jgi:hypothetical protein
MKRWRLSIRSIINAGIAIGLSALVVAAVVTPGLPVTHVSANDGGVWVTSNSQATFARYVDPIGQIDTGFGPPGGFQTTYRLNVLQQGTTVVAWDQAKADIYPVNVVQGTVSTNGVALPGGVAAKVALGGSVLAVLDPANGKIWAANVGDSTGSSFGPQEFSGTPITALRGAVAIAVSQLGTVYVSTSKELWTLPFDGSGFSKPTVQLYRHAMTGRIQLSVVGTTPVVLDDSALSLYFPSTRASVLIPDDSTSQPTLLQQPGPAASDVLVATSRALDAFPLTGGAPTNLASVSQGLPARPVYLAGCAYGAWSGSPGQLVRSCAGAPVSKSLLLGATLNEPVFRVNNGVALLNDANSGDAWSVNQHPKLVIRKKDYQMLSQAQRGRQQSKHQTALVNTATDKPIAENVNTEGIPGSIAILHLLDYASNPLGGPLSISSISPPIGPGYQTEISADTQTVSLQISSGDSNPIHFAYTVVNSKGFTATGSVTVTPTLNSTAPYLKPRFVSRQYTIASNASATYQVLSGWRDAQNEPLALLNAKSTIGSVSWTGTGLVTLTAPAVTSDTVGAINYVLTNGVQRSVGVVHFDVLGTGTTRAVAPIAQPNVVQVSVGQTVVDHPLANNIPGADPLHPSATLALAGPLVAPTGLSVTTDVTRGSVSIKAVQQGIFVLPYQVAFGSAPLSSSEILVIARPPIASQDKPVTAPASVLLHGSQPATVDVLAGDYDPLGGLLTVVSASSPTGIDVAVIKGKWLRIESTQGSFSGWKLVSYRVTNGLSTPVQGVVAIACTPLGSISPPIVPTISTQVLAGSYVDVSALNNAVDPTGGSMELVPGSVTVSPPADGSAYIVGGVLRYAAPTNLPSGSNADPTVNYVVEDEFGEETTGTVRVTVLPSKHIPTVPPTPADINVRAIAGSRVVIPIRTTGIDANGEASSVVGITTPPQLGRILSMNATSITYQAYPNVAGTDTFSYTVENTSGQQGIGTIRVGIVPPQGLVPVTATPVFATAAPGNVLAIDLLESVIASPQAHLRITPLQGVNSHVPRGAVLRGGQLYVTAPANGHSIELNYGAVDGVGAESTSTVTIRGQTGYRSPPFAADYYPSIPAAGGKVVTVNVLGRSYNVGGGKGGLRLVKVFGLGALVQGSSVRATLGAVPREVTYEIANGVGATALGIIHLPGLRSGAFAITSQHPIQVPLGGSKLVNIDQYVKDTQGSVRLISDAGVFSSPASGLASHPVSYTNVNLSDVGKYDGPGALVVQVTSAAKTVSAATASDFVSLPVQVGPAEPILSCPKTPLQLLQGGSRLTASLSSMCEVWVPNGVDPANLQYKVAWKTPLPSVGLATSDSGRQLQLTPGSSYHAGVVGVLNVSIAGTTAHSELYVSVAPAPLASMRPITVQGVTDGHTVSVNVAKAVTSPLAKPSIKVLTVTQTFGPTAKAQVSGSNVLITPSAGAVGIETFVLSATDLASEPTTRRFTGTITLQLLAPPGVPGPILGTPGNGVAVLTWSPASTNGSPIDFYQLALAGAKSVVVHGTSHVWRGLKNGQAYSFTVRAHNSQGFGPATSATTVVPQSLPGVPGAVQATPGNGEISLRWGSAQANGAAVSYQISVTPAPPSGGGSRIVTGTNYVWNGLDNAVGPYIFTVTPINKLGPGPSVASTPVYTFGRPTRPNPPAAAGSVSPDQTTTTISVSWPIATNCNDARPCGSYTLIEYRDGAVAATVPSAGTPCASGSGELCQSFGPLANDGSRYTYALEQTNVEGLVSPVSSVSAPAIQADGIPGAVSDLTVQPKNNELIASFSLPPSNSSGIADVTYSLANGSGGAGVSGTWSSPGSSGSTVNETIGGLVNGDTYSLTVTACNAVGECGSASNSASAIPYGVPNPPSVTASASGDSVTYSWTGGGDNGRPVSSYHVCIDGSCSSYGNPSSVTDSYACGTSHSVYATVIDTAGQTSQPSPTVTATTATCAPKTVKVSLGSGGEITSLSWSNFPTSPYSGYQTYTCNYSQNNVDTHTNSSYSAGFLGTASSGGSWCSPESGGAFSSSITIDGVTSNTVTYYPTTPTTTPSVSISLGSGGGLSKLSWSNFPSSYPSEHTFTCNYSIGNSNSSSNYTYSASAGFTGSGSVAGTGGGSGNNLCYVSSAGSMSVTIDGYTSNTVTYAG